MLPYWAIILLFPFGLAIPAIGYIALSAGNWKDARKIILFGYPWIVLLLLSTCTANCGRITKNDKTAATFGVCDVTP